MPLSKRDTALLEQAKIFLEKGLLLLPLITGVAYLASYIFEAAFLSMYHLPRQLVVIKTENFIFIFLALSFIVTYGYLFYEERKTLHFFGKNLFSKVYTYVLLVSLILLLLVPLPASVSVAIVVGGAVFTITFLRSPKLFKEITPLKITSTHPMLPLLVIIIGIWSVCAVSFWLGRTYAFTQDTTITYNLNNNKYAVIETFNDSYLMARVDKKDHIQDYQIMLIEDLSGKPFKVEKLELVKFNIKSWVNDIW